ncbi:unnamed protein product [Phytomonas sp. Hart1]|nr:unnamed protein product [Phytomonas sp. Hart1]|eukprot:CCW70548.1 unnamed protein product [Phytomonas sp. isolate Hart1]
MAKVLVTHKMVGVALFDGELELLDDTQLYYIREKIRARHGNTPTDLKMWKSKVEPLNIIRDMSVTIRDLFELPKSPETSELINRVTIFYDFGPSKMKSVLLTKC